MGTAATVPTTEIRCLSPGFSYNESRQKKIVLDYRRGIKTPELVDELQKYL
jgi:hypothetical protein